MGWIAATVRALIPATKKQFAGMVPVWQSGQAQLPSARYDVYAREGYMRNEIVYACIEELATSAAEPSMKARVGNTWTTTHPALSLLDAPNPFLDRFQFWATIILHRSLAGNAYALKIRSGSGRVVELWLMRPDRVRIVPSRVEYISHYTYSIGGGEVFNIPEEDVIHFKTRHPLDDWYGMPPLMAVSGRTDIDNFMSNFVKSAFENGGMPGAILSVKQKIDPDEREAIRRRFRENYGGPSGWHELLILEEAEASYTPMTMQLGQRGLVVPELDQISEARIPMAFGVPQSLIGTRTSYENGGYANKRAEETHFWTGTLIPLYRELAGALNLKLVPEFPRLNEIAFDTSDVRALQEDEDKVHARLREDARAGVISLQEAREGMGFPAKWPDDAVFLIPSSSVGVSGDDLEEPGMGAEVPANRQNGSTAPMMQEEPEPMMAASRNGSTAE